MRSALFRLLAFLVPMGALAQINPATNINWPPSCHGNPAAAYSPTDNNCFRTTTTGGLPVNNPTFTGIMQGPSITADDIAARGQPWWDVTAYGADPTGTADSTAAFNTQLRTCLNTGGTVFAPAGDYLVTGLDMSRPAYSDIRCTLAGAGRDATRIKTTAAGSITVDAIGASNITIRDLNLTTYGVIAQTGILFARSTVSTTAAFNLIENVNIGGMFSNCAMVSIAAETTKRYNVHFYNVNSAAPYPDTAFCTSGANDFGITSTHGTIYASTNTDNETYGDEFYCNQTSNPLCVIISNGGGWKFFGSAFEVSNSGTGGAAVQLQLTNLAGVGNIFNGPVEFISPHIEGNQPVAFYLKGITGTYNYWMGVKIDGGALVLYAPVVQQLVAGNDSDATGTHNILSGWDIRKPYYVGGGGTGALTVSVWGVMKGTYIDLINSNLTAGPTLVNLSSVSEESVVKTWVTNEQGFNWNSPQTTSSVGLPNGTSFQGGYFAVGHVIKNSTASATGPLEWIVTTAGYVAKGAWTASTAYLTGDYVTNANKMYVLTQPGTSGTTAPVHTSGLASDGSLTWLYVSPAIIPAVFTPVQGVAPPTTAAIVTTRTEGTAANSPLKKALGNCYTGYSGGSLQPTTVPAGQLYCTSAVQTAAVAAGGPTLGFVNATITGTGTTAFTNGNGAGGTDSPTAVTATYEGTGNSSFCTGDPHNADSSGTTGLTLPGCVANSSTFFSQTVGTNNNSDVLFPSAWVVTGGDAGDHVVRETWWRINNLSTLYNLEWDTNYHTSGNDYFGWGFHWSKARTMFEYCPQECTSWAKVKMINQVDGSTKTTYPLIQGHIYHTRIFMDRGAVGVCTASSPSNCFFYKTLCIEDVTAGEPLVCYNLLDATTNAVPGGIPVSYPTWTKNQYALQHQIDMFGNSSSTSSIDIDSDSLVAYSVTSSTWFTGVKVMGSCTVTIQNGLIANVTGC